MQSSLWSTKYGEARWSILDRALLQPIAKAQLTSIIDRSDTYYAAWLFMSAISHDTSIAQEVTLKIKMYQDLGTTNDKHAVY